MISSVISSSLFPITKFFFCKITDIRFSSEYFFKIGLISFKNLAVLEELNLLKLLLTLFLLSLYLEICNFNSSTVA